MKEFDIAVIGAGPAGCMAAIRAAELGKKVVIIERNEDIGKKILLSGKGRCNITNSAPLDTFVEKFQKEGNFFRSAFFSFFNQDLIGFFESRGLKMKIERQNRIFPDTDSALSVVNILKGALSKNKVTILYKSRLASIKKKNNLFELQMSDTDKISAKKVILATGGKSYKETGSTGDGFNIAYKLGHTIIRLKPWLVPLKTKEAWVKELQGLGLKNVRIIFKAGKKKIASPIGEIMFTHFGISGPLVLDLSGDIVSALEKDEKANLFIDLKPALQTEELENRLLNEFKDNGSTQINNLFKVLLPVRLIPVFIRLLKMDPERKASQITQKDRDAILSLLKAFPLTITGSLPIEEAMVTGGGISLKEINPRTMESKIIPGLYFAGEIIDGAASSGGFNIQRAFSTGYLAGEKASNA